MSCQRAMSLPWLSGCNEFLVFWWSRSLVTGSCVSVSCRDGSFGVPDWRDQATVCAETQSPDQGRLSTRSVGIKLFVRGHTGCLCSWSTTLTACRRMLTDTPAVTLVSSTCVQLCWFLLCSRACSACCRSHSLCVCACACFSAWFQVHLPPAAVVNVGLQPLRRVGGLRSSQGLSLHGTCNLCQTRCPCLRRPCVWLLSLEGHPLQVTYHADRVTGQSRLQKVTTSWTHWPQLNPYTQHHSSHGQHN